MKKTKFSDFLSDIFWARKKTQTFMIPTIQYSMIIIMVVINIVAIVHSNISCFYELTCNSVCKMFIKA